MNTLKRKQRIRLTESDLHNIIKESVKNILRENDMTYTNFVNIIGADDVDDEWNLAAACERKEDLETQIWQTISQKLCGRNNPRRTPFHFKDLVKIMASFGFDDYEQNDDDKSVIFHNSENGYEFTVWPNCYYPHMDELTIFNTNIF